MSSLSVTPYTKSGGSATTAIKLDKNVFAVETENHELLKLAYSTYLSNGRDNLAKVKTRGLVRGGGRKPHKQKGTGRARAGSIRSPIWRGGGVIFGPTGEENYTKKLPRQAKRLALRQSLSLAAQDSRIKIIEQLGSSEGKTQATLKLLGKIKADSGSCVIVVDNIDPLLQRAIRNLPSVKLISARYLNVFDCLNADTLVITKPGLAELSVWLGEKAS
ncbi:MAG TPA: 50S ribosomal protein L4 [Candidatus Saccharimonadales bacterium]|nr:50S ribosomal protein L4 [Candidatus Saccharimonadales bacterium]